MLDQFEKYAPEVIESFKELAKTGCVEFLAETYAHSLASIGSQEEFIAQVKKHSLRIEALFGQKPKVFRNTELIYSDEIGATVAQMGFSGMLTEGAKHVLGWKSPNYIYTNAINPRLKLLLKNFQLSDDIAFRFSDRSWANWPLTSDKYVTWLSKSLEKDDIVNLFMDYETFGEHQQSSTGIFQFLKHLPAAVLSQTDFEFCTPSEVCKKHQPRCAASCPVCDIMGRRRERRICMDRAMNCKMKHLESFMMHVKRFLKQEMHHFCPIFINFRESDHFYYMCTKFFSDGAVHKYFNPYDTPYEAFINYMNVLSDFFGKSLINTPQQRKSKSGTKIAANKGSKKA